MVGIVLLAMVASMTRRPGVAALLSQDYTSMMAGLLAPEVQTGDAAVLTSALAEQGLRFAPRIVTLEPDFTLLGGRRHLVEAREGAAWFYRAASAEMAIAEAFEGRLDELGAPDDTRTERTRRCACTARPLRPSCAGRTAARVHVAHRRCQGEVVVRLAKRLAETTVPAR